MPLIKGKTKQKVLSNKLPIRLPRSKFICNCLNIKKIRWDSSACHPDEPSNRSQQNTVNCMIISVFFCF